MTQQQLVEDLSMFVVYFTCAASIAFLLVYTLLARGYRTEIGRMLITLDLGLTMALFPSVLHKLFGVSIESLAFAWYFVVSIALVGAATWGRTYLVVAIQWRNRNVPPEEKEKAEESEPDGAHSPSS